MADRTARTAPAPPLCLRGAAASHTGLVRDHNEDSGFAGPGLVLVADGVGGHAAGEVASATATHVLAAAPLARPCADLPSALHAALEVAQQEVARGSGRPGRRGMATTLTAVLGDGERFALLHLGDSRAYLCRRGGLRRLSRDHTVVQDLVDHGALRAEEARGHRWGHVVTRVLAGDPAEAGDVLPLDLEADDRLLLCSDGLTDLVDDGEIAAVLAAHDDPHHAADALVAAALRAGGRDNVTCAVATVVPEVPASWDGQLVGAACDARLVAGLAAARPA